MKLPLQTVPIILITFGLCLLITRSLITLLPKFGMIDEPGARRMHKKITPRGGGIAVLLAFSFGFYAIDYFWLGGGYSRALLMPLWAIALVSFYDDIKHVNVALRFLVQIIVSACLTYIFLLPNLLFHGEFPGVIDFVMAIITFAGFINIYNFMDGIDGLTSAQSLHLSITMLLICALRYDVIMHVDLVISISLLIMACSIAFLVYNWHPAYIFLGDVGSITFGLLIGLALMLIASSAERLFVSTIIATLYYLADGGLTIIIRAIRREKIWLPHLNHFFQQAMRKRLSQKKIMLEIILCNYWLMILAVSALFYPVFSLLLAMFVVTRTILKFAE
ncbi:MAG: hypothetical protein RLZZ59_910 [Pseudomonadota bacterium]|jgi:UDP-N-acetylmuramyl pentapeptide phosphotransferase/UDP-N-acetylglucosamine-1-phosphate transferase